MHDEGWVVPNLAYNDQAARDVMCELAEAVPFPTEEDFKVYQEREVSGAERVIKIGFMLGMISDDQIGFELAKHRNGCGSNATGCTLSLHKQRPGFAPLVRCGTDRRQSWLIVGSLPFSCWSGIHDVHAFARVAAPHRLRRAAAPLLATPNLAGVALAGLLRQGPGKASGDQAEAEAAETETKSEAGGKSCPAGEGAALPGIPRDTQKAVGRNSDRHPSEEDCPGTREKQAIESCVRTQQLDCPGTRGKTPLPD